METEMVLALLLTGAFCLTSYAIVAIAMALFGKVLYWLGID